MIKKILIVFLIFTWISYANGFTIAKNQTLNFKLNKNVGKNELNFVSEAPFEDIFGNVETNVISSEFTLNPSNFTSVKGIVKFKVSGMETGINKRDEHLKSSEWLDAINYPEISFEIKSFKNIKIVDKSGNSREKIEAEVFGIFSMHGVSKEITLPITLTYMPESDKTKKRANGEFINANGEFKVKLEDYNVKGAKGLIGKKVGEEITIEFNLYYNSN